MRRKFIRRKVAVYDVDDIWGADLVDMVEWSRSNKGYKYILNVIDMYSKYAWAVPLKDKRGETVTEAFKYIVNISNRRPKHIWCDEGKEFYNKNMNEWLNKNNINRYSTHGEHKSCVVERFNRTLKEKMWKRFTAENTRNWVGMLDKLLTEYNKSFHRTIGMTPIRCSKLKNIKIQSFNVVCKTPKFKVGDKVRISRLKAVFEKGYLSNWSEAIYVIQKVKRTCPVTYILEDMRGELLKGSFYEKELLQTNQEVYRIEKVLRKKNINGVEYAFVKWMGYSNKFNDWIPVKNLYKPKT